MRLSSYNRLRGSIRFSKSLRLRRSNVFCLLLRKLIPWVRPLSIYLN